MQYMEKQEKDWIFYRKKLSENIFFINFFYLSRVFTLKKMNKKWTNYGQIGEGDKKLQK